MQRLKLDALYHFIQTDPLPCGVMSESRSLRDASPNSWRKCHGSRLENDRGKQRVEHDLRAATNADTCPACPVREGADGGSYIRADGLDKLDGR